MTDGNVISLIVAKRASPTKLLHARNASRNAQASSRGPFDRLGCLTYDYGCPLVSLPFSELVMQCHLMPTSQLAHATVKCAGPGSPASDP